MPGHNKVMNLTLLLLTIVSGLLSGCDHSIKTYEAGNPHEREIIAVLVRYQNARNRFDLETLLSLLDDDGVFTFGCGQMVSKNDLKSLLPALWAELRANNHAVIPIVHECINGDYLKSGQLYNPEIRIDGNMAETSVLFARNFCRLPLYVSLHRQNQHWLITRTEWGQN